MSSAATLSEHERQMAQAIAVIEQMAAVVCVHACLQPWSPFGVITGIELTDLFAQEPGTGAGTKVMNFIKEQVNELRLPLYLRPSSDRSRGFYARCGLVPDRRNLGFMVLYPSLDEEELEEMAFTERQRS